MVLSLSGLPFCSRSALTSCDVAAALRRLRLRIRGSSNTGCAKSGSALGQVCLTWRVSSKLLWTWSARKAL